MVSVERYTERPAEAGITPSMGSRGDSYGNALTESVIGLHKSEIIHSYVVNSCPLITWRETVPYPSKGLTADRLKMESRAPKSSITGLTVALLLVGCGGGGDTVTPTPPDPNTIGSVGGTVSAENGTVRLTIPAGALSSTTRITVDRVTNPPADPNLAGGTSFDFGPDGTQFAVPVTMQLTWDSALLPNDVAPEQLTIAKLVSGAWEPLAATPVVNVAARTVAAPVLSFSSYAIVADPCLPKTLAVGGSISGQWRDGDCVFTETDEVETREDFYTVTTTGGTFEVSLTADGLPTIAGFERNGNALAFGTGPDAGGTAQFSVTLPAGSHQLFAGSRGILGVGNYQLSVLSEPELQSLGCGRVRYVIPPFSSSQTLTRGVDCTVQIAFPPPGFEPFLGKPVLEEYYRVKLTAGQTINITVIRGSGETAFASLPTLFLGNGDVVSGNPALTTNTLSWTSPDTRWVTVGVSGGFFGDGQGNAIPSQGSYTIQIGVN